MLRFFVLLSLALLFLPACSSSGDKPAPTAIPIGSDDELAQVAMLELTDFPSDWVEQPNDTKLEGPFVDCFDFSAVTARATTAYFMPHEEFPGSIVQSVFVFRTQDAASGFIEGFVASAECVAEGMNKGEELAPGVFPVKDAKTAPSTLDVPAGEALVLAFTFRQPGGSEELLYRHLSFTSVGRVAYGITAQSPVAPDDELESILRRLVKVIEGRLASVSY